MVGRIGGAVCLVAMLIAAPGCANSSGLPTSPTPAAADTGVAVDGSTLKVTSPTAQSPVGGVRLTNLKPVLRVQNASARFTLSPALTYRFEVQTMAGAVVATSGAVVGGGGTTSWEVPFDLALDTRYRWRARAELNGKFGPWTGYSEFLTIDYRGLNPGSADQPGS